MIDTDTNPRPSVWHRVTWYSKLGAAIVLFGAVPALCFYIGVEFEKVTAVPEERIVMVSTQDRSREDWYEANGILPEEVLRLLEAGGFSEIRLPEPAYIQIPDKDSLMPIWHYLDDSRPTSVSRPVFIRAQATELEGAAYGISVGNELPHNSDPAWATSGQNVYYKGIKMPQLEATSFENLGYDADSKGCARVPYIKDKNGVYVLKWSAETTTYMLEKVEGADPATFKILGGMYGRDKEYLYIKETRTDLDPDDPNNYPSCV